ncbi:MAG: molybdopterin-dependent oxidoreductase, partial [Acidobacteriota bacterium]|nr:molybdopterin-dependent oxidoreductase [Acidobacteriota bacterium]
EFINHADRIKTPLIRYTKGGKLIPATWDDAIHFVANKFKESGNNIGVVASARLTNESVFTLKRFAEEVASTDNFAVSDAYDLAPVFDNLSVPLCTHKEIRHAKTILLIGGEPEEEQTFTGKQIRQAVRNDGANFIVVHDTTIRITEQATQFIHINKGSFDAFALAFADAPDTAILKKIGAAQSEIDELLKTIGESAGDFIIMLGRDLSPEAQAVIANSAANFGSENRRVLLHPLPLYNNSVGANDMSAGKKSLAGVLRNSKSLLIGGSLSEDDAKLLANKDFVVVQELFETATTDFADVVLPAASFAEVDGTYTNNTGFVQRVRQAIEPVNQSKPDWAITSLIAREMGVDFGYNFAATAVFKALADAIPAYEGIRYPHLKDESRPVQVKHQIVEKLDLTGEIEILKQKVDAMPDEPGKNTVKPKVGHKLHRLTTLTSKTPQFHLLAHGNPKPENLLVSPLVQFNLDGTPRVENFALAAAVGVGDKIEDKENVAHKVIEK